MNFPKPNNYATWQEWANAVTKVLAQDDFAKIAQAPSLLTPFTTDDLNEGTTNLYFTNERVDDRAAALIQNGTGLTWTYVDGSNTLTGNVSLAPFTTSNLSEGSNLYFTNERVDDRAAALIQNGTGITWVYDDTLGTLTGTVSLSPFSTSDLAEGSRLYYTDERVDDRVAALIQNGTGITWTYDDTLGTLTPTVTITQYTDEMAQDAVGGALTDTAEVDFTYNDGAGTITADLKSNSIVVGRMHASATNVLFGRSTAAAGAGEEIACTSFARSILDDAAASDVRTTLGLGTAAVQNIGTSGATVPLLSTANTWTTDQIIGGNLTLTTAGGANVIMTVQSEGVATALIERLSANSNNATLTGRKGRGTIAARDVPITNDNIFDFTSSVVTSSSTNQNTGRLRFMLTETSAVDATHLGTRAILSLCPIGSGTITEVCRWDNEAGFSMFGANPVIDQNRVFRPRSYTVATVPAVTATGLVSVSDEGGRVASIYADGTNWRRHRDLQVISATVDYTGVWGSLSARATPTLLSLIQGTYSRLSDAGLLTKLKGLWVHAMPNQTDALLNWITPGTRNMSIAAGSPTFTANVGFTGDGSASLLTTGATLATFGATQNDVSYGCYIKTAGSSAKAVIGQNNAANGRSHYFQTNTSGALAVAIMNTPNAGDTFTPSAYTGLMVLTRSAAAAWNASRQDEAASSYTRTSSASTARTLAFLGTTDTTATESTDAQICFSFIGTNLSAADIANLRAIMVDYFLVGVGAVTAAVADLPPAANFSKATYYIPDLGGGAGLLQSDGTNWFRTSGGYEARTLATGSETLKYLTNAENVEYTQTLSGNVTVTLSGVDAKGTAVKKGARFVITHNNATPGAFTFTVNDGPSATGLITFGSATNKAAIFVFDGTNWRLMLDAAI